MEIKAEQNILLIIIYIYMNVQETEFLLILSMKKQN